MATFFHVSSLGGMETFVILVFLFFLLQIPVGEQRVTSYKENTKENNSTVDSIVIAFWVGLAAFVTFLFLILLYMSRSGSTPVKQVIVGNQVEESASNGEQPHCDELSSPYSDVVTPQTSTSLSDETGIHGRI